MKHLFALIAFFAFATFATAQDAPAAEPAASNGPNMDFEKTEMDYGTIDKGSDPLRIFNFTNTGTEPLVIKSAKGSCGCTVPSYPKEPILPGEASTIEVRYDTKRVGPFRKSVTLTTNEDVGKRVLKIKGKVLAPAAEPEAVPESTGGF